jgi:pimeloyl-ACP methyl ester carboxylesterase
MTTAPGITTERTLVADGVELTTDRWIPVGAPGGVASPPPFVLVHGLASNARMWDGVAARLADLGYPVVTVDLRGHGRSSKPEAGYDVPQVADDLAVLIDRLGLGRSVVAGQSWGGNVVLEMAARHPTVPRGIACIDGGWLDPRATYPDWDACLAALAPPRLIGRPLTQIEGYVRSNHRDWPETGILGALANFEVRSDGTIAPWLSYEHHLEVLHGLWEHHPSDRYAALDVPVLLVPVDTEAGDRTRRKRLEVDAAAGAIPHVRVRWFSGDHDIHAQHPNELADLFDTCVRDGFFG